MCACQATNRAQDYLVNERVHVGVAVLGTHHDGPPVQTRNVQDQQHRSRKVVDGVPESAECLASPPNLVVEVHQDQAEEDLTDVASSIVPSHGQLVAPFVTVGYVVLGAEVEVVRPLWRNKELPARNKVGHSENVFDCHETPEAGKYFEFSTH